MDHSLNTLPPGNYLLTILPEKDGHRVWNINTMARRDMLENTFEALNQQANIDKAQALEESKG